MKYIASSKISEYGQRVVTIKNLLDAGEAHLYKTEAKALQTLTDTKGLISRVHDHGFFAF